MAKKREMGQKEYGSEEDSEEEQGVERSTWSRNARER